MEKAAEIRSRALRMRRCAFMVESFEYNHRENFFATSALKEYGRKYGKESSRVRSYG